MEDKAKTEGETTVEQPRTARWIVEEALDYLSMFLFVKPQDDDNRDVVTKLVEDYKRSGSASFTFNEELQDGSVIPIEITIGTLTNPNKPKSKRRTKARSQSSRKGAR